MKEKYDKCVELEYLIHYFFVSLDLPVPKPIEFTSVKTDSVGLSWGAPEGLIGPFQFIVTWKNKVDHGSLVVSGTQVEIHDLNLGEEYTFTVATLNDGSQSPCVSATVRTGVDPLSSQVQSLVWHCSICCYSCI